MEELTSENLITINQEILKKFGGKEGDVDVGKLEFILTKVSNTEDVYNKSAILLAEILKQKPFKDENRRTAFEATRILQQINGKDLRVYDPEKLIQLFKDTYEGKIGVLDVKEWLKKHE